MSHVDDPTCLSELAFLYLYMAHGPDRSFTDSDLETVTSRLIERSAHARREQVQPLVREALALYAEHNDIERAFRQAIHRLRYSLNETQRQSVLEDMVFIAEADGDLKTVERSTLERLADTWELGSNEQRPGSARSTRWDVLHDLAYLYLVLAHGTDDELSGDEMQVMLNKLREWTSHDAPEDVRAVLDEATSAYALGPDASRLERAIESVRRGLPKEQRMAALNDLVKIANADGVFLDDEEDLINHLLSAWDVDPYANYGEHGSKV